MAALAPPPYRSSQAALPSTSRSSSSPTISSIPSRKQENSAAVAAGRRKLEEYRRKKANEKEHKASPSTSSNEVPISAVELRQLVPSGVGDATISQSWQADSNGHVFKDSLNDGINKVSVQGSLPHEVARLHKETGAGPSISGVQVPKGSDLKSMSSGVNSNDGSSTRVSRSNALEQPVISLSGTAIGNAERGVGVFPGVDSKNTNRAGLPALPFGAAGPLFVPAPPLSAHENSIPLNSGSVKLESTKIPNRARPSPFGQPSMSQGLQSAFNPSAQKVNGANLVMLDSKLVAKKSAREGPPPSNSAESEKELAPSAKPSFSSTLAPSNERLRTDKQNDATTSASASSAFSQNNMANSFDVKLENEKGSIYPVVNSSFVTQPSLSGSKASLKKSESPFFYPTFSDTSPPKYLPLPPLKRPSATSSLKSEPFLDGVSTNLPGPGSSSNAVSVALSNPISDLDNNEFLQPSPPPGFQFPGPIAAVSTALENGREVLVDSFESVLSRPSVPVADFPAESVKVVEAVNQPHQLWTPSSAGEDFAMLEQHIEDLTQEKFSLQRGLDGARALAESLAREISDLTEDYNNQGALVNNLKAENDRQHEEIRAQVVIVKSMKAERDKAMQENSAAVERSQTLAAEVIALEGKVLRARSQELKLKRDMESIGSELELQKRQILSLDKDRANLKSLVEALQEEKGLLQAQIRKTATNIADSRHPLKNPLSTGSGVSSKTDASTSTDDFELETFMTLDQGSTSAPHSAIQSSFLQSQLMGFISSEQHYGQPRIGGSAVPSRPLVSPSYADQASASFSPRNVTGTAGQSFSMPSGILGGRGLSLDPVSSVMPPDQAATIENINTLITELAEEKEALLKALRAESVGAAELRNLNAELSHKLEVQTQRLELAVAQSMAHGSTQRVENPYSASRVGPEFVDEGDEVVDRVLGWIMQLFPSGSSRRKRL